MAKSSLDLRGAKGPKLELDFLRLAYVVRDIRTAGGNAVGYLAVLDSKVAETASTWIEKYRSGDAVVVLMCHLGMREHELLMSEKSANAIGFLPAPELRKLERKLAIADLGRELGEQALQKAIEEHHPGIMKCTNPPFGIQWDYYGIVQPNR
ncbi:MAG: hypothetical protein J0M04_24950 [Verrucomicrobia bacterium]|nr:hypothetical protein [Verrucomicrobiota bacterium]